jgi:hypothetical protein
MKRRFFLVLLTTTTLVVALLTTTTFVTTPSARAGQVPFGTVTSPDIPISHRDRVYTADQWSNTVTVTDPVDNKLLGVIRLEFSGVHRHGNQYRETHHLCRTLAA